MRIVAGLTMERALRRLRWVGFAAAEAAERRRAEEQTAAARHGEGEHGEGQR